MEVMYELDGSQLKGLHTGMNLSHRRFLEECIENELNVNKIL